VSAAERATDAAGVVTVAIGAALALWPARTAAALGLGSRRGQARAIGLADLALGPGLLLGRPRWPWMAARAALNLVIARQYRAQLGISQLRRTSAGATAMSVLTVVDAAVAVRLAGSAAPAPRTRGNAHRRTGEIS